MPTDQVSHAFVDESCRNGVYRLAVVRVAEADLDQARRALRAELLAGQRSIHFTDESDARRRRLLERFGQLAGRVDHYSGPRAGYRNAEHVRAGLLATLAADLMASGVTRLVLESRDGRDGRDRAVLRAAFGPRPTCAYDHLRKHEEPLLWLADGFAWAEGKGGLWAARARMTVS
jgi:hypothetical protein